MLDANNLCFAEEELVYLLRALSIDSFPGLEEQPFARLTEEQRVLLMAMADRTLRAHGIVSRENREMSSIHPLIAGILRDCAASHYTLFVDIALHDERVAPSLYHLVSHGVIQHYTPEAGIHQFLLVPKMHDIGKRLFLPKEASEAEQKQAEPDVIGQLHVEMLNTIFSYTATEPEHMRNMLAQELPAETARLLGNALIEHTALWHLALWQETTEPRAKHRAMTALTIIQHDEMYLLLWKKSPHAHRVDLLTASTAQMRMSVEAFLHEVETLIVKQSENIAN